MEIFLGNSLQKSEIYSHYSGNEENVGNSLEDLSIDINLSILISVFLVFSRR